MEEQLENENRKKMRGTHFRLKGNSKEIGHGVVSVVPGKGIRSFARVNLALKGGLYGANNKLPHPHRNGGGGYRYEREKGLQEKKGLELYGRPWPKGTS